MTEPRKKILLVDDSSTVVNVLRTYLMGAGCDFFVASDGKMALRAALRERPDLVISDIEMPEMDGLELGRALRAAPGLRHTRIVLISSKWTEERRRAVAGLTGTTMMTKPVDPEALVKLAAGLA